MKVDPNIEAAAKAQSDAVQNARTSRPELTKTEGTTTDLSSSDTVQVSPKFAEVQQLTSKLQQVPEIRSDRVSALKAKIQQGTYNPGTADVAGALLNDPLNRTNKS
jgi:negative regulator of flagellin synthesis FlgM